MSELSEQVDELKARNQELTERERMYQLVCRSAVGAFLYCSFENKLVCALGQWKDFFDFDVQNMSDIFKILDVVDEQYAMRLRKVLFLETTGEQTAAVECLLKDKRCWMLFSVEVCYTEQGQPADQVIYINDITKSRSQNEELIYMAYYDSTTGLYNRNYFVRLLSEYVKRAAEYHHTVSIIIIDVDDKGEELVFRN